jgi:hypothetical protein
VGGFEHLRQGVDLIPQGLGVDLQTFPAHDADLSFQRQMIEVLLGGDLHGKLDGVAVPPRVLPHRQSRGRRRRLDVTVAPAAILLPAMPDEDEPPLDHGHLFGVLELAGHQINTLARVRGRLAKR